MAFGDLPKVDRSIENSEKSSLRLKACLNIKSGFILREDIPDYGCDFDAELVINKSDVSNLRFPIQLKSVEKLNIIGAGEYISYAFETSRLGYLMRRIPSNGIVVIYSVEQDLCYYEYCDRIYQRIMDEKQSQNWFRNEKINIHIPLGNILDNSSAVKIHLTFKNRFDQAAMMQNSIGRKYGLPSVISAENSKYDFNNPEEIKLFLQNHGMLLLNSHDIHITYRMIEKIPITELYGNTDLMLIAAVSYGEMFMHAESKLFTSKLSKLNLPEDTKLILRFIEMKNDLALGYLDTDKFIQELELLVKTDINSENKITIEINIIHFKLAKKRGLEPFPEGILTEIIKVFSEIENLPPSRRQNNFLLLWNCENLSSFITTLEGDLLGEFAIRESMNGIVDKMERLRATKQKMELETKYFGVLHDINKKAVANSDKVLNAHVFSQDIRHFISSQINYVAFEFPVHEIPGFQEKLLNKITLVAKTYNNFIELNLPNYSYEMLCNMIDLIELAESYQIATPHNKVELYKTKEVMENLPQVISRSLIFPGLLARKKFERENPPSVDNGILKDINDVQMETLARNTLQSMNLPEDHLPNILHEMKAHQLFSQRCTNPNIDFLQDQNPFHRYTKKGRFLLRNKESGLISLPNSDMDALLTDWGF